MSSCFANSSAPVCLLLRNSPQLYATGASLHLCMTPHGPDTKTYERAILPTSEEPQQLPANTLAFMFETSFTPRVTAAALGSPHVDRGYYKCWLGLKSHFDPNNHEGLPQNDSQQLDGLKLPQRMQAQLS